LGGGAGPEWLALHTNRRKFLITIEPRSGRRQTEKEPSNWVASDIKYFHENLVNKSENCENGIYFRKNGNKNMRYFY